MARSRLVVALLDQEPRFLGFAPALHPHERPAAAEFLPCKREPEVPVTIGATRIAVGNPRAGVPDHDRPRTVLALGDHALEARVLERVVLDVDREPLFSGIETRALGDRPARERAVELEPEIVVQLTGGMLVHDEAQSLLSPRRSAPLGLRRLREIALATVMLEAHGGLSTAESMPHADVLRVRARRLAAGNSCKRPQYRLPEIVSRGGGGCRAARQPA